MIENNNFETNFNLNNENKKLNSMKFLFILIGIFSDVIIGFVLFFVFKKCDIENGKLYSSAILTGIFIKAVISIIVIPILIFFLYKYLT